MDMVEPVAGATATVPRGDLVLPVTLMPPDGLNSTSFTESLLRLYIQDAGRHLAPPMFTPTSPMQIAANRNRAAAFLLDETDAAWLLFIDSDMGFDSNALELLLAAGSEERPIVGGLCFGMRKEESDGQGGFRSVPFPTIYQFRADESGQGFHPRLDYPRDTVVQCAATGAAFLLIHRSALEKIRENLGDTWFERAKLTPESEVMGEDLSFCLRAGGLGIPVFVHTGVRISHLKPVWVGEDFYQDARVLAALAVEAVEDDQDPCPRCTHTRTMHISSGCAVLVDGERCYCRGEVR